MQLFVYIESIRTLYRTERKMPEQHAQNLLQHTIITIYLFPIPKPIQYDITQELIRISKKIKKQMNSCSRSTNTESHKVQTATIDQIHIKTDKQRHQKGKG